MHILLFKGNSITYKVKLICQMESPWIYIFILQIACLHRVLEGLRKFYLILKDILKDLLLFQSLICHKANSRINVAITYCLNQFIFNIYTSFSFPNYFFNNFTISLLYPSICYICYNTPKIIVNTQAQ